MLSHRFYIYEKRVFCPSALKQQFFNLVWYLGPFYINSFISALYAILEAFSYYKIDITYSNSGHLIVVPEC